MKDYVSFVGFMIYYLHHVHLDERNSASPLSRTGLGMDLSPIRSSDGGQEGCSNANGHGMMLLLGGYSYGSLITALLPTTDVILSQFSDRREGTAVAECIAKAVDLARQWNRGTRRDRNGNRGSRDTTRNDDAKLLDDESLRPADIPLPQTSYLLISPLLPPISTLAAMSFTYSFQEVGKQEKLVRHRTLAIYGDKDVFTAHGKLQRWAERLADEPNSKFLFQKIGGAGHFWREDGVEEHMRAAIEGWVPGVLPEGKLDTTC